MAKEIVLEVTPQELKSAADVIENHAGNYQKVYERLYEVAGAMKADWDGVDNQAYIKRIEGFREDFQGMHDLMIKYKNFLIETANNYQKTQDNVKGQAETLIN